MEVSADEVEFRKAVHGDIPKLKELINKRWDRKVSEKELENRIEHGIEFVAVHKPTGRVVGQMSGIVTRDFKPSWLEHIGLGDVQKRADKNGRILTLYQLTVDPEVRVKNLRVAEELRNRHLEHAKTLGKTLGDTVQKGFSRVLSRFVKQRLVEIRTHSPIQDLNEMLFKNEKFKSYVEGKFKVRLESEGDFFKLPPKIQEGIALARLHYTEPSFDKGEVEVEEIDGGVFANVRHENKGEQERLVKAMTRFHELTKHLGGGFKPAVRLLKASMDDRPDSFERFKKENRVLIKKMFKGRAFGIEDYFELLGRKPESTLRFHAGGGARIDRVYAGGSEEKHRSLGVAVSYKY